MLGSVSNGELVNCVLQHKCYYCGEVITAASTAVEHIIPNALGGKLKSRTILCSLCNSKLGNEVDAPFCQQMGFVVNRLGIKREKGDPPAIKARCVATGDPIHIESDGTTFAPRTKIQIVEGGYIIECDRKNIRKAQETLKRKVPNVQFNQVEPFEADIEFRHDSNFGGKACYRAVTKIALNYYLLRGGSTTSISEAIAFVKHGGDNIFVIPYYPTRDVLPQRLDKQITHVVTVRGDPVQKLLYAYVELFTAFRFLVYLSGTYDGKFMSDSYCFDLRQWKEVKTDTLFYESRTTIADKAASTVYFEALKKQIQALFAGDLEITFCSDTK
jgi:HNH endonuclease